MLIQGKPVMYELLRKGAFGNIIRTWSSEEELYRAYDNGFRGNLSIRTATKTDEGHRPCFENLDFSLAIRMGRELVQQGYTVYYSEAPPDHLLRINAEYVLRDGVPYMEYSTIKTSMRKALAQQRLYGVSTGATLILRRVLSPASFEDITLLAEQFPDAVIEFSAYDVFVGEMKGRNAIVWECRHLYLRTDR